MAVQVVVMVQRAMREAAAALMEQVPQPAPADKAREYRQVAAFLAATARDLELLAACEEGLSEIEAAERRRAFRLVAGSAAVGELVGVAQSVAAPRSPAQTDTAGPTAAGPQT